MATDPARHRGSSRLTTGAAALAGLACLQASAQELRARPEIETSVTVTSNAAYATASEAKADVIVSASPRLVVSSRGGRVSLNGDIGVEGVAYANTSGASLVRPRGALNLRTEVLERWVFVDASVGADRSSANPYAARPESASAFNDYTSMRYRLTPYIERQLTPRLSILARSDHLVTRRVGAASAFDQGGGDPVRDAYVQSHLLQGVMTPMPFGAAVEFTHDDTRLRHETSSLLTQTGARAIATYATEFQVTVGAIVGRETNEYSVTKRTDSIIGAEIKWRPDERTSLDARVEKRFFGTGYTVEWRQRSPFFGTNFTLDRRPIAQAGSRLVGSAGSNVRTLLDDVLTTRFPSEGQRTELVDRIVRDLNLPETLISPIDLFTSYAQLQDTLSGTLFVYGRLTTVSATAYALQRRRLVGVEGVLAPSAQTSDNRQYGFEVLVNRRLSRTWTADAGLRVSRISGLGARRGDATTDAIVQAGLSVATSAFTRLGVGARHQAVRSTAATSARETAMVATLVHRF